MRAIVLILPFLVAACATPVERERFYVPTSIDGTTTYPEEEYEPEPIRALGYAETRCTWSQYRDPDDETVTYPLAGPPLPPARPKSAGQRGTIVKAKC